MVFFRESSCKFITSQVRFRDCFEVQQSASSVVVRPMERGKECVTLSQNHKWKKNVKNVYFTNYIILTAIAVEADGN